MTAVVFVCLAEVQIAMANTQDHNHTQDSSEFLNDERLEKIGYLNGELLHQGGYWIHRRKESVTVIDETAVRRTVSVDFTLPEVIDGKPFNAIVQHPRDGEPVFCPPLFVLPKASNELMSFDLRSESSVSLPLMTRRDNARVSGATLVALGKRALGEPPSPNLAERLTKIATADTVRPVAAERLMCAEAGDPDFDQLQRLCKHSVFKWWLWTLAHSSLVGVPYRDPTVRRKIFVLSYIESFAHSLRVRTRLGWTPYKVVIDSSWIGARNFHFEAEAPPGLRITKALLAEDGDDVKLAKDKRCARAGGNGIGSAMAASEVPSLKQEGRANPAQKETLPSAGEGASTPLRLGWWRWRGSKSVDGRPSAVTVGDRAQPAGRQVADGSVGQGDGGAERGNRDDEPADQEGASGRVGLGDVGAEPVDGDREEHDGCAERVNGDRKEPDGAERVDGDRKKPDGAEPVDGDRQVSSGGGERVDGDARSPDGPAGTLRGVSGGAPVLAANTLGKDDADQEVNGLLRRVHLSRYEASRAGAGTATLDLRVNGPGFVGGALLACGLVVAAVALCLIKAEAIAKNPTSAPAALLLLPGVIATYVGRADRHALTTRLLLFARWLLLLAGLAAYGCAAFVALGGGRPKTSAEMNNRIDHLKLVFFVGSVVAVTSFAGLALGWLLANPTVRGFLRQAVYFSWVGSVWSMLKRSHFAHSVLLPLSGSALLGEIASEKERLLNLKKKRHEVRERAISDGLMIIRVDRASTWTLWLQVREGDGEVELKLLGTCLPRLFLWPIRPLLLRREARAAGKRLRSYGESLRQMPIHPHTPRESA
jgi:hypothetical protein